MSPRPEQPAYRDFILAFLEFRRYRDKHPDLASFHERRYRAFCSMLGTDLEHAPTLGEDRDEATLHHAFEDVVRFYFTVSTPFVGCLEAPPRLIQLVASYEARCSALSEKQRDVCLDLLCDLAGAIYGPCKRRVKPDELERLGVGRSQAPDPDDYF